MADLRSPPGSLTLGILTWRFIIWRRNKDTPPTTTVHLPQKPELIHLADTEKGPDYADKIPLPPPAYNPGLVKSSPTPSKPTPALNLNVTDCDTGEARLSPLRSLSFNLSSKAQSWSSRVSSRVSTGAKKLYAYLPG